MYLVLIFDFCGLKIVNSGDLQVGEMAQKIRSLAMQICGTEELVNSCVWLNICNPSIRVGEKREKGYWLSMGF